MRRSPIFAGVLLVAGCGTSASMTGKNPEPYGGVKSDWNYIASRFENGTAADQKLNIAATVVDLPLSLLCDTLMLPKFAYDYWTQEPVECPCDAFESTRSSADSHEETWRRGGHAFEDMPKQMTPERIDGGIIK